MKRTFKTVFSLQAVLITVLLTLASMVNAQTTSGNPSPTFEQTVNYLVTNTKGRVMYPGALDAYSRVKGYTLKDVKIEKNGKVVLITDQKHDYNNFTITFNIFDLIATTEYPGGVIAKDFLVHFNGLNVSNGYGIVYATQNDALKVARAFRHLRLVCEKPKNDLFSQHEIEEKKTLGIEETIKYLDDHILIGLWLGDCKCYELEYYDNGYGSRGKENGLSSYYIKSHKLGQTTYTVYASSNRDDCREGSYWNSNKDLVRGNLMENSIRAEFKFDISKLINFEISNLTNDDKTKILRLVFQPNTCTSRNISNVNFLSPFKIWTSNSLEFRVLTENAEKVKKAILHLQTLLIEEKKKAEEDDPFGN